MSTKTRFIDVAGLTGFLCAQAADRTLMREALAELDWYFDAADAETYPLVAVNDVDRDAVVSAVQVAFGRHPVLLEILSAEAGIESFPDSCLELEIRSTRRYLLRDFQRELEAVMTDDMREVLATVIYECLGQAMYEGLRERLQATGLFLHMSNPQEGNDIAMVPFRCVFYMMAFALLGDRFRYMACRDLARVHRGAILLGSVEDTPLWLVLAA